MDTETFMFRLLVVLGICAFIKYLGIVQMAMAMFIGVSSQ